MGARKGTHYSFGTWLAAIVMLSEIDLDKRIAQLLHDFAAIGLWTGGSIILFWLLKEHQGYSLWILACTTGIAYIRLDVKKRVRLWRPSCSCHRAFGRCIRSTSNYEPYYASFCTTISGQLASKRDGWGGVSGY